MTLDFNTFFTKPQSMHTLIDGSGEHILVAGCSHTYGVGIDIKDCYVNILADYYGIPTVNLGIPGGNHMLCSNNILQWVKDKRPTSIVVQWPDPIRLTVWYSEKGQLENIHSCNEAFKQLLKSGEENFYASWLNSVITINMLCRALQIPIVNMLLGTIEQQHLDTLRFYGIDLHIDEKQPGRNWIFDSQASDKMHHSSRCHRQWAERIIGILDENTA
jgi:hypothetical protein